MTFDASAFLPNGHDRTPGKLRIEPGRVFFDAAGGSSPAVELPFRDLELRLGGANDRLVFFSHPEHPGLSVYTSDRRVLEHPHLATEANIIAQLAKVRSQRRRGHLITAAVLLSLVFAVIGLVMLKDPLVGLITDWIPPELEVQLGDVAFRQITAQTELIGDEGLDHRLDELAAPLLAALPDSGYPFELHLARDPTLNAFALPGGNMVLHSGLILAAESPEEVLGVVAHEIAHVTHRHSLRQIVSSAGVFVLFQTLFGDFSGIAAIIADGGFQLLTLRFSREHELEADNAGFDYLLAAGIDPRGMLTFFEKMQAEQERMLGDAAAIEGSLSFLSTHPATAERIERLTERLAMAGTTSTFADFGSFDFAAFQEDLRRLAEEEAPGSAERTGQEPEYEETRNEEPDIRED